MFWRTRTKATNDTIVSPLSYCTRLTLMTCGDQAPSLLHRCCSEKRALLKKEILELENLLESSASQVVTVLTAINATQQRAGCHVGTALTVDHGLRTITNALMQPRQHLDNGNKKPSGLCCYIFTK
ncbi:hypothetical protein Q1695_015611 [Nippostrongylus brasiliensis]|nr:hypothetical protein Q1695_015611 [Nippostrongylus brasiliensis]